METSLQCVVLAQARNGTALCFLLYARNVFALAKSNFKNPVELFHTYLLAMEFSEYPSCSHGREGVVLQVISEMSFILFYFLVHLLGTEENTLKLVRNLLL